MYPTISTHTSLLARLADGSDPTAWREFSERYSELIRGFAQRRGLQPADCDDITQDVLLSLSKALPGFRYDPSKGKFRSFLKTVTVRRIIEKKRQKKGEVPAEPIEQAARVAADQPDAETAWEKEWRRYHLRQALRTIHGEFNENDRQAFQWYALERRDAAGTATALGLSVDHVYQAKSRITKRLAQIIAAQVRDEG
jgi:RNA polymerase sigma-70 factor (ECF subfamily)